MFGFEPIKGIAGGDIYPSRFVKLSGSADHTLLEADANEATIGISTEAQRDAPISGASTLAAAQGDPVSTYPVGTICKLLIGSGGITRGAFIKSDADGKGVAAATSGTTLQWIGAQAIESAAAGEFATVIVLPPTPYRPAIA